jgi:hypothetical protein
MAQEFERTKRILADDLDDRQIRGMRLKAAADRSNGMVILRNDSTSIWRSKRGNRAWDVERQLRNRRGDVVIEYRCPCGDFLKNGRIDCQHIFAERLRRGEVIVIGNVARKRMEWAEASRRPARKRYAANGKPMRSIQRDARVAIPDRVPQLLRDLVRSMKQGFDGVRPAKSDQRHITRAATLVVKIAYGKSNDAMQSVFTQLIADGILDLKKAPHQNTLSRWMNDPALTPFLEKILEKTAKPFRLMECAAIVDSSKMSQMRSAHSRWVEYGDDERENADWMKLHALVGVETLVCMSVDFSGTNSGDGKYPVHDVNFILPLVEKTRGIFNLRFIFADKAYLSERVVGELREMGMQAVIPVKKRVDGKKMKVHFEAFQHLVEWFDKRQPDFHEKYRVRSKVESFFSFLKSVTSGFCWSRGRPRKDADGTIIDNSLVPCTAWKNETLCKVNYVNLRITVNYELSTGYHMSYLSDTFFPSIPEDDRLVA